MGMYKYLRTSYRNISKEDKKTRLYNWRRQSATVRIDNPTRLDRARALGYKAKQGYIMVRQRVVRGGHEREHYRGGKRSKNMSARKNLSINYRRIAEMRAVEGYKNCEVLNSYYVIKDGKFYWYEVILIDRSHPGIVKDKRISWITKSKHKGRVFRGKTSAGRKSRNGLSFRSLPSLKRH